MYKFLAKHGQMMAFGLGVFVVLLFLIFAWMGLSEFNVMEEEAQTGSNIFNVGLYGAIVIAVLCAIAWLGFGIFQSVTNLKGSTQGLIGVAIIIGIFLVSYFVLSKPDTGSLLETVQEFNVSEGNSKLVGGALWTSVLLIGVAGGAFIVSEIRNLFK